MKRALGGLVPKVLKRSKPSYIDALSLNVDPDWYLKTYADVRQANLDPVAHFLTTGIWEGRSPNRFFDPAWYLQQHPEAGGGLPLVHYAKVGRSRGYDPGPKFSVSGYLEAHPDVAASGFDALDHYVRHGQHEGRVVVSAKVTGGADDRPADGKTRRAVPDFLDASPFETETLARVNEALSPRIAAASVPPPPPVAAPAPPAVAPPTDPALRGSPFWFYNCLLNAEGTILRYARNDLVPDPDYLTNFIGVKVAPRHAGTVLDGRTGQIEAPPLPSNWHADLTEWTAALRAVDLAGPHFKMAALGCGWGCWMNNTGAAARQTGRSVFLIGVEDDKQRVALAQDALAVNGFGNDEYVLHHAIATAEAGITLFSRDEVSEKEFASEPVAAAAQQVAGAAVPGMHRAVEPMALSVLLSDGLPLDLLHLDIRGGEADFVLAFIDELSKHVAYLAIRTHSRQVEGRLFEGLMAHGWVLEIERPAYLDLDAELGAIIKIDGAQGWRNARLRPD